MTPAKPKVVRVGDARAISEIPTSEIQNDIADTLREIAQMEREIEGFRLLDDRMSHFRADARVDGIRERKQFIAKLEAILASRKASAESAEGDE